MKERAIQFSGPMVKSILAGKKTMTRRVVKNSPCMDEYPDAKPTAVITTGYKLPVVEWSSSLLAGRGSCIAPFHSTCTYGAVGGRLWVREDWRTGKKLDGLDASGITNKAEDAGYKPDGGKPWGEFKPCPLVYEADGLHLRWADNDFEDHNFGPLGRLRSSLFMPRWASRITLEITCVRVERLQDINEADAKAEGTMTQLCGVHHSESMKFSHRNGFINLWSKINGKSHPWESNPWVWVIEFKRMTGEPK